MYPPVKGHTYEFHCHSRQGDVEAYDAIMGDNNCKFRVGNGTSPLTMSILNQVMEEFNLRSETDKFVIK